MTAAANAMNTMAERENLHYGKLYLPLRFSSNSVTGTIDVIIWIYATSRKRLITDTHFFHDVIILLLKTCFMNLGNAIFL